MCDYIIYNIYRKFTNYIIQILHIQCLDSLSSASYRSIVNFNVMLEALQCTVHAQYFKQKLMCWSLKLLIMLHDVMGAALSCWHFEMIGLVMWTK